MKPQRLFTITLRLFALFFLTAAGVIAFNQYSRFTETRLLYPPGSMIAGVPVGGLNSAQAISRLQQAYGIPIELKYSQSIIQVRPDQVGFELELTAMLTEAELLRMSQTSWADFLGYLEGRKPAPIQVELQAKVDEQQLRAYLEKEISPRYDQPAQPAMPIPGTTTFLPGKTGLALNLDLAIPQIAAALRSLTMRTVELASVTVTPSPPLIQNLQVMLSQNLSLSGFSGLTEIFVENLKTREKIQFAFQNGKLIAPDISFTAASTIKIPIMVSTFKRISEPVDSKVLENLALMIAVSENDPADWLMQQVMNKDSGPLDVTRDMQDLGLKNTFLAGYFYPGAPLLKRFATPANQRTDINTDPDPYNQTTPGEIGLVLEAIYQCAENGGGVFSTRFPGEITQNECNQMSQFLLQNQLPVLIAAGVPEGTKIGHKHGWIREMDGLVHTFSDAAIVYSPGGDYVMTVYLWSKSQILFDTANFLVADLSRAVYNYFNLPTP